MTALHLALYTIIAAAIGALLAVMLEAIVQRRRAAARATVKDSLVVAPATPADPGPSGMGALQALQLHDLAAVHGQGLVTALMDHARAPKPPSANPYAEGQPRAVWFAGYAMAQGRAGVDHTQQAAP